MANAMLLAGKAAYAMYQNTKLLITQLPKAIAWIVAESKVIWANTVALFANRTAQTAYTTGAYGMVVATQQTTQSLTKLGSVFAWMGTKFMAFGGWLSGVLLKIPFLGKALLWFSGVLKAVGVAMGIALGPVAWVIIAVVAAIALAIAIVPKLLGMLQSTNSAVKLLGVALLVILWPLTAIYLGLKAVWAILKMVVVIIAYAAEIIWQAIKPAVDAVMLAFNALGEALRPILDLFADAGEESSFMQSLMEGLKLTLMAVGKVFGFIINVALWPFVQVIRVLAMTVQYLATIVTPVFEWIARVIRGARDAFQGFVDVIVGAQEILTNAFNTITLGMFQSSMFKITEGVADVMPSLESLHGSFMGIADTMGTLGEFGGLGKVLGGEKSLVVSPAAATAPVQMIAPMGGAGTEQAAVSRSGVTGAMGGGVPRIVIPITLMLDGRVLAETVEEYQGVELARLFNPPTTALRGIGG